MLILATGSNCGDSLQLLSAAKKTLSQHFQLMAQSRIYTSKAVEYRQQPDFYNQVLQFAPPLLTPENILDITSAIEQQYGRTREIPSGPRTMDIDIIFLGIEPYRGSTVTLPHPRALKRSFVVRPLSELPYGEEIQKHYPFPEQFETEAFPLATSS